MNFYKLYTRNILLMLFVFFLFGNSVIGQKGRFPSFYGGIGTPSNIKGFSLWAGGKNALSIGTNGCVGVGTTEPLFPFTIFTTQYTTGLYHTDGIVAIETRIVAPAAFVGTSSNHSLNFMTSGSPRMSISTDGNVGIGTAITGSYKLAVEGMLGARSIEVKSASWADFVFDKNYKLKPLKDVEDFINTHKHLPDVPSEEQVKKEGINLGNMDAVLLQKIEELTLYAIEQNKRIEAIEKENALLKKKITMQ